MLGNFAVASGEYHRVEENTKARERAWQKNATPFSSNAFVDAVNKNLDQKRKEYEAVKAKRFGAVRGFFTRYEEKETFLNDVLSVALRACRDNDNETTRTQLKKALLECVNQFTTCERQSGLAKLCEAAYFALEYAQTAAHANFNLAADKAEFATPAAPVVEIVFAKPDSHSNTVRETKPVVGTVVDPTTYNLSRLFVPRHALPTVAQVVDHTASSTPREKCYSN